MEAIEIKEIRNKLNKTQEQFARVVGVTVNTVNRWENGKSKPTPLAVMRLKECQKEKHQ